MSKINNKKCITKNLNVISHGVVNYTKLVSFKSQYY